MVRRMRKLYAAASEGERAEGRAWYDDARATAEALAAASPYDVDACASVIAATSVGIAWPENVRTATIAVDSHARGIRHTRWVGAQGWPESLRKADAILSGDASALSGPKVTVFKRAIMGDPSAVTVDRWMVRATGAGDGTKAPGKRLHASIARAVESAAAADGESPRDYQAIVWVRMRNRTFASGAPRYARLVSESGRGSERI